MKYIIPFTTISSIIIFLVLSLDFPKILRDSAEVPDTFVNTNVEKKNVEEFDPSKKAKIPFSLSREYGYRFFMYSEILRFNTDSTFERESIGCTGTNLRMGHFSIKEDSLFLTDTREEREFALEENPSETNEKENNIMEFDSGTHLIDYTITIDPTFASETKIVDIEIPYSDTLLITEDGLLKGLEKINTKIYF